jgi:hypothetical protein
VGVVKEFEFQNNVKNFTLFLNSFFRLNHGLKKILQRHYGNPEI